MAKYTGIFNVTGSTGKLTFSNTRHGQILRDKPSISPERIATDPAFQRSRENSKEFGTASKASKTLRMALRPALALASDHTMLGRLNKKMLEVVKTDMVSARGERQVMGGNLQLLKDFEFNEVNPLSTSFRAKYSASIDSNTGAFDIWIPSFIPTMVMTTTWNYSHFQIMAVAADVDFRNASFKTLQKESPILPLTNMPVAPIQLSMVLVPGSDNPLFLALGIEFFVEAGGKYYPAKDGHGKSIKLIDIV